SRMRSAMLAFAPACMSDASSFVPSQRSTVPSAFTMSGICSDDTTAYAFIAVVEHERLSFCERLGERQAWREGRRLRIKAAADARTVIAVLHFEFFVEAITPEP